MGVGRWVYLDGYGPIVVIWYASSTMGYAHSCIEGEGPLNMGGMHYYIWGPPYRRRLCMRWNGGRQAAGGRRVSAGVRYSRGTATGFVVPVPILSNLLIFMLFSSFYYVSVYYCVS